MSARRVPGLVLAAVLLAAPALAGCAQDVTGQATATSASPTTHVEELTVGGQAAVAIVPGTDSPRGLVLYLHGAGETAASLTEGADQQRIAERLVGDGYVMAASDAHFDAFGNAASQQDYVDLAAELSERYGTTRTYLLAESMGTMPGLQILAAQRIPGTVGLAAINPAIDISAVVGTQFEAAVRAAYDGQLPTGTQNPAALPADAFAGDPIRFYLAENDQTAVTAVHAAPFLAKVQGVADTSVVACQGMHVDPSCFQPDDLADWFAQITP